MDRVPYVVPLALYALAAFAHLLPGVIAGLDKRARTLVIIGVVAHILALIAAIALGDHRPGAPEGISGTALGIMGAYAVVAEGRMRSLGLVLAPLAVVLLATSLVVPHADVVALDHVGPSPLLPVHLGLMFAGIGGFALSFAVGIAYLFTRDRLKSRDVRAIGKLPPLELLDRLQFRATLFGFLFLTLGTAVGGIWAATRLDEPWVLDAKVLSTLVIWSWYGLVLFARLLGGLRGRWSALLSVVGFGGMLLSMVTLFLINGGWHSYER